MTKQGLARGDRVLVAPNGWTATVLATAKMPDNRFAVAVTYDLGQTWATAPATVDEDRCQRLLN